MLIKERITFLEMLLNVGIEQHAVRDSLNSTTARKGEEGRKQGGKNGEKGKGGREDGKKKIDEASVAKGQSCRI